MKKTAPLLLATLVALIVFMGESPRSRVRAQSTCSAASLSGSYAYQFSGFYYVGQTMNAYASLGAFSADGNGNITGSDSFSQAGTVERAIPYTGTYQVSSGCTGSVALHGNQGTSNFDFVLLDGGAALNFIQTDAGTVIPGTAQKQFITIAAPRR